MPTCRNCGREIGKHDADLCPYCGTKNPIGEDYLTKDMTSFVDPVGQYELYKSRSRKTSALLCLFLGWLGIHSFYLRFKKRGIIELAISLVLIGGVGSLLLLSPLHPAFCYLIPFGVAFLAYAILSIRYFKDETLKDGNGEFLR